MTQITDELIDRVTANTEMFRNDVRHILAAAYPLIRAQVLEEAAGACERLDETAGGYADDGYVYGVRRCAQAIRNLMTDTAVAVPKEGEGE
jgi:hypothetical protein